MKNLLFLFLLVFVSCGKSDLEHAKTSLKGTWTVVGIYSQTSAGGNQDESGNLGTFEFKDNELIYSFTKGGVTKNGQAPWTLTRELVNSGFVKVEKYTLDTDGLSFDCAFGDQTEDAEQNAQEIRLEATDASGLTYQLWMEKN